MRVLSSGQRVVFTPYSKLIHHELASRAALKDTYDLRSFEKAWGKLFAEGDPFFHPNLSGEHDDFRPDHEPPRLVFAGGPRLPKHRIKRVLAVKLDHIGDFVTALPAIRRLRRTFPDARLCLLTGRAAKTLASMEPGIDEVIEFEFFHARSGLGRKEIAQEEFEALARRLAPYRFDLAVDLRKADDTRQVLRYTGAEYLAGFDHVDRHPWLDIAVEWEGDPRLFLKRQHVSEDLLRLVDAIAIACEQDRTTLPRDQLGSGLDNVLLPSAARRLFRKRVVCLHPGVGQETRQWPPEHFATLADMLVEKCGVHVVLIGGPDEAELAKLVRATMRHKRGAVSLAGKIPLGDLPRVLAASALYVGNNSGPKHIAAGLGVPTVGIHSGVVDATEWGPVGPAAVAIQRTMTCSPCYIAKLADCPRHFACMRGLEPAAVFEVCERMLALRTNGVSAGLPGRSERRPAIRAA